MFDSVFFIKKQSNKQTNVAAVLMCCTKSFLETECENETYLAILSYLGCNYKNAAYPGFICQKRNIDFGNTHIQYCHSGMSKVIY